MILEIKLYIAAPFRYSMSRY